MGHQVWILGLQCEPRRQEEDVGGVGSDDFRDDILDRPCVSKER